MFSKYRRQHLFDSLLFALIRVNNIDLPSQVPKIQHVKEALHYQLSMMNIAVVPMSVALVVD